MKKSIIIIAFLFCALVTTAQVSEGSLIVVHSTTSTEKNTLHPNEGTMVYNTTDQSLYVYNGTAWENYKNLQTTYETIAIGNNNQIINVRDASKIIGFSLISNYNSLSKNTGKMADTWIIDNDREKLRCHIQTYEHPYLKNIAVSVQINNAANTITISNYISRYWTITNTLPQNRLSNSGTNYRLGKIVIIRKE